MSSRGLQPAGTGHRGTQQGRGCPGSCRDLPPVRGLRGAARPEPPPLSALSQVGLLAVPGVPGLPVPPGERQPRGRVQARAGVGVPRADGPSPVHPQGPAVTAGPEPPRRWPLASGTFCPAGRRGQSSIKAQLSKAALALGDVGPWGCVAGSDAPLGDRAGLCRGRDEVEGNFSARLQAQGLCRTPTSHRPTGTICSASTCQGLEGAA